MSDNIEREAVEFLKSQKPGKVYTASQMQRAFAAGWAAAAARHPKVWSRSRLLHATRDLIVPHQFLTAPLPESWSARLRNALIERGANTVGDVVTLTETEILRMPNLGAGSWRELCTWLSANNLRFRMVKELSIPEADKQGPHPDLCLYCLTGHAHYCELADKTVVGTPAHHMPPL